MMFIITKKIHTFLRTKISHKRKVESDTQAEKSVRKSQLSCVSPTYDQLDHKEHLESPEPVFIAILGPPASGKGTICRDVQRLLNSNPRLLVTTISTGEILREKLENDPDSNESKLIKKQMEDGILCAPETVLPHVFSKIETCKQTAIKNGQQAIFFLDGFPREIALLDAFQNKFGSLDALLNVLCDDNTAINRALSRKDEKGNVRSDDTEASMKKRLNTFRYSTTPVITKLNDDDKCIVYPLDGTASKIDVVNNALASLKLSWPQFMIF
ncbi:hypothetical protein HK096_004957 [Nowakowskiella sp. JEL0078]|nr:hypothetical protein HK096_004957 [Nowakowskiella sp. JEL0078]